MTSRRSIYQLAGAVAALAVSWAPAFGDFTPVLVGGEPSHIEILECIYGAGFVPLGATDFENPTLGITVVRIDDFINGDPEALGDDLDIGSPSSSATDQVWQDGHVRAMATARFASYPHGLGFYMGTSGSSYSHVLSVSGSGCNVAGGGEISFQPGEQWRWVDSTVSWTSRTSDNDPDGNGVGEDHMVSYRVFGAHGGATAFLLFFEDLAGLGDRDYNDFGVELVVTEVDVDIKPGSCPNALNPNGMGVIPIALVGSEAFDVSQVDLASIQLVRADAVGGTVAPLDGAPGLHPTFEDVATPFAGDACDCHAFTSDGITDLSLKFDTTEVVAALQLTGLQGGLQLELELSGHQLDGTPFYGTDCVLLVSPPHGHAGVWLAPASQVTGGVSELTAGAGASESVSQEASGSDGGPLLAIRSSLPEEGGGWLDVVNGRPGAQGILLGSTTEGATCLRRFGATFYPAKPFVIDVFSLDGNGQLLGVLHVPGVPDLYGSGFVVEAVVRDPSAMGGRAISNVVWLPAGARAVGK